MTPRWKNLRQFNIVQSNQCTRLTDLALMMRRVLWGVSMLLALGSMSGTAQARSVLLVDSDWEHAGALQSALSATGFFTQVDSFDVHYAMPTLAQLDSYDAVLAWTNSPLVRPYSTTPDGLGNLLADYVDDGGGLLLAGGSFSKTWGISGRIMTPGYSPLVNVGVNGVNSGHMTALAPHDPLFDGVDLGSLLYFNNKNAAHPQLDSSATLLATDGNGIDMIARSHSGKVLGYNFMPVLDADPRYVEVVQGFHDTGGLVQLFSNGLISVSDASPACAPEPGSMALLTAGTIVLAMGLRRRQFLGTA